LTQVQVGDAALRRPFPKIFRGFALMARRDIFHRGLRIPEPAPKVGDLWTPHTALFNINGNPLGKHFLTNG